MLIDTVGGYIVDSVPLWELRRVCYDPFNFTLRWFVTVKQVSYKILPTAAQAFAQKQSHYFFCSLENLPLLRQSSQTDTHHEDGTKDVPTQDPLGR